MLSLEQLQSSMMAALDKGPNHLHPEMFTGSPASWLRGMKVYANTVSHGRLVALEETFPKTRSAMGEEKFNQLSRQYLEYPDVTGLSLNVIGSLFGGFLASEQVEQSVLDLARVEWAWLESYRAAEAKPLELADLGGLSETAVLDLGITLHPSTRTVAFEGSPHPLLTDEIADLCDGHGVLIVRPFQQVLLSALDTAQKTLTDHLGAPTTVGLLFARLDEDGEIFDTLPNLIALIKRGAIIRT